MLYESVFGRLQIVRSNLGVDGIMFTVLSFTVNPGSVTANRSGSEVEENDTPFHFATFYTERRGRKKAQHSHLIQTV